MGDLVSWALLGLLGASLLNLVLVVGGGLAGRTSRRSADEREWRRCNACRASWKATERDRPSAAVLRLAGARRRVAKAVGVSRGRLRASWARCPRCLSTDVRASRLNQMSR